MKYNQYLVFILFLFLFACSEDSSSPTAPDQNNEVSFANDVQLIFNNNCIGCHNPTGPASFLNLSAGVSYANLVNVPSGQDSSWLLVDPTDDSKSLLYQKLKGTATVGPNAVMPPAGMLDSELVDKVEQWINEGAKNN